MSQDREDRIRERAQAIWEQEGRPEGRHEEHWGRARQEIEEDAARRQLAAEGRGEGDQRPQDGILPEDDLVAAAALLRRT